MAKMGKFKVKGMKELQKELNKIQDKDKQQFIESCAKELAARLLAELIDNTPVGDYPKSTGKKGGTLKRGWNVNYSSGFDVRREGNSYIIELINPVEYASYVEYGHRTANHEGWIPGLFFVERAVNTVDGYSKELLERKIEKWLATMFK